MAAPIVLAPAGPHNAPFDIPIAADQILKVVTGFAHWDGSGASGDFLPALSFYAANGTLLSRVFPSTTVTAGASADVSYAPFPGGIGNSSPSGSGIDFDQANVGGYLDIAVTDFAAPNLSIVSNIGDGSHSNPALVNMVFGFVRDGTLGGSSGDIIFSLPSRGFWRFYRQYAGAPASPQVEVVNIKWNGAIDFPRLGADGGGQIYDCTSIQCMAFDIDPADNPGQSTFLGGMLAGPPLSTTYYFASVRDWIVDSKGDIWVCVASGTPGTWKRVRPYNSATVASSGTPTINTDRTDVFEITALAANITSMTTNLTGTPIRGQRLHIAITDNGTSRSITWGAKFEGSTVGLPAATVISTRLDVDFIWNPVTSAWRCIQVA